jgi:hypothetical protein
MINDADGVIYVKLTVKIVNYAVNRQSLEFSDGNAVIYDRYLRCHFLLTPYVHNTGYCAVCVSRVGEKVCGGGCRLESVRACVHVCLLYVYLCLYVWDDGGVLLNHYVCGAAVDVAKCL